MNKLLIFLALGAIAQACSSSTTIAQNQEKEKSSDGSLPPYAEVKYEICWNRKINPCHDGTEYHWLPVEGAKLDKYPSPNGQSIYFKSYIQSRGCTFNPPVAPKELAWYSIPMYAKELVESKGETATIRLVSVQEIPVEERWNVWYTPHLTREYECEKLEEK